MVQQTTTRRNAVKSDQKITRPFWTKFAVAVFAVGGLIGFAAVKNVQNPPSVTMINSAEELSQTEHFDKLEDLESKILSLQQQILSLDKSMHEFRSTPKCRIIPPNSKELTCKR